MQFYNDMILLSYPDVPKSYLIVPEVTQVSETLAFGVLGVCVLGRIMTEMLFK